MVAEGGPRHVAHSTTRADPTQDRMIKQPHAPVPHPRRGRVHAVIADRGFLHRFRDHHRRMTSTEAYAIGS